MMDKGINGITQEHVDCPLTMKWSSMLPKDRKEVVDEVGIRQKNHLGTRAHLIEMLGDTADADEEAADVLTEMKTEAKIAAMAKPAPASPPKSGGGDDNDEDDTPTKDKKTTKPDNKMM
jgi:hypothetical protein